MTMKRKVIAKVGLWIAILYMLVIAFTGCKKSNPQPSNPPQQQAPPPANTNTTTISQYEQALLGRWLSDSIVYYVGSTRDHLIMLQTDTNVCRINFYSTDNSLYTGQKNGDFGHLNCALNAGSWKAPTAGVVTINNITENILQLTSVKLVLSTGSYRYYLHK